MASVFDELDALPTRSKRPNVMDDLAAVPVDAPWYIDALQAADDVARLFAQGATFGQADKIAGFLGGEGVAAEQAKTAEAASRAGSAALPAEMTGAVALPLGLAEQGVTLAGRFGTGAMTGLKGLLARSGLMAAEGAGYGSTAAALNDRDVGNGAIVGALMGAGGNIAGEALSAGVNKVAGSLMKKPTGMSTEQLRSAADRAYQTADNAGVIFGPGGLQRLSGNIKSELANFGYHPSLQPRIATVLGELDRLQGGNVTYKGMDVLRRIANSARQSMDKSEQALGNRIIAQIDDFMGNIQPGDVLAGNTAQASEAITTARDMWGRMRKSEMIGEAVQKATRRAASTGSGGNVDNATRQIIRGILDSPSKRRGFTPDEVAAMEKVVSGTPIQNAFRLVGKLSPSGNGLMAALGIGATAANPLMAAAPAAGMVAKTIADRATPANVRQLSEIIRAGGKASAVPQAPQLLSGAKRDAIARALMGAGVYGLTGPQ